MAENKETKVQTQTPKEPNRLDLILSRKDIQDRFHGMLGKKAAGFISSIISSVNQNSYLKQCDPMTVVASAAVAASLDLPINPNLGFAYIVPYKDMAQFQMGWKGFVQLALRSGYYKTINVSEVYTDELKGWNPLTGEIEFTAQDGWKQRYAGDYSKIIGYMAFLRLLNGFEKYVYLTREQVQAHAVKYSKSVDSDKGQWKLNFDAMAKKTLVKLLLSKYGILSIEMQKAITTDQAVIKEDGSPDYVDGHSDIIDAEAQEMPKTKSEAVQPAPQAPAPEATK